MKSDFQREINLSYVAILQQIHRKKQYQMRSHNDTINIIKNQNQLLDQRVEHFQGFYLYVKFIENRISKCTI